MNMKKVFQIGCLAIVATVLALVTVGTTAVFLSFRHKIYTDAKAQTFIASRYYLSKLWKECGLDRDDISITRIVAARGVMQSGSRFYAIAKVPFSPLQYLERYKLREETEYKDHILKLTVEGPQYQISGKVSDGPESIAIVPSGTTNIILFYCYGGDGG